MTLEKRITYSKGICYSQMINIAEFVCFFPLKLKTFIIPVLMSRKIITYSKRICYSQITNIAEFVWVFFFY